jgi:DNA-binding NarL/FixJ family response regulator
MIRILVVDDHPVVREGLAGMLSTQPDLEVVGEASDGRDAVARAEELRPDVAVLDIAMPLMNGIEAARVIHGELPTTRIGMLTVSDDDEDLYEALKAGATGYLMKDFLFKDLPGAVRVIAQGHGLLISPEIAHKLVKEFQEARSPQEGTSLTSRELEVLRLVSLGRANHEIAEELCLSSHTVKRHVANILAKLHQRSRLDAVMHAIRSGVLSEAP